MFRYQRSGIRYQTIPTRAIGCTKQFSTVGSIESSLESCMRSLTIWKVRVYRA